MQSPFPGMDPYLEDPGGWRGVHDGLIALICTDLNRRLGRDFVADAGTSVYVLTPDEQRWVYPDIFIVATRWQAESDSGARIAAPVQVLLDVPDTVSLSHVLIRDRISRQVVTIVEILSPINKASPDSRGRQDFLRKRAEVFASLTNWVEIDLLRAGERPPETAGAGDYYALVKRRGFPMVGIWPSGLRDRLPTIGIPLCGDADDVPLDLQALLDQLYTDRRYAEQVDYRKAPPPPALSRADARWVAEQVSAWEGARRDNGVNSR